MWVQVCCVSIPSNWKLNFLSFEVICRMKDSKSNSIANFSEARIEILIVVLARRSQASTVKFLGVTFSIFVSKVTGPVIA